MPLSFDTSSMAASARMNRATQVVTRLAFCFFEPLYPHGQDSHDGAPLRIAHPRPAGDLRKRSTAADTKARLAVEQADIDARRFQGGVCPAAGPGANVGIGVAPGNCRREAQTCGLLAATRTRPECEGDGAPKSAKSLWLVPCGTRAPSGAPITAVPASGPAFVRSVARECADRSVSQLLAGTPSGPGGSSNAARVPRCDEARRRRTSSRLTTPQDHAPQRTRCVHDKRGLEGGDCAGQLTRSRRYDGVRCCSENANPPLPLWRGLPARRAKRDDRREG